MRRKGLDVLRFNYSRFSSRFKQLSTVVETFSSSNPSIAALVWIGAKLNILISYSVKTRHSIDHFMVRSQVISPPTLTNPVSMSFNELCQRFTECQILSNSGLSPRWSRSYSKHLQKDSTCLVFWILTSRVYIYYLTDKRLPVEPLKK